jgi:DNA repair exonuclease SbcCD ATPase subunit
MVKRDDHPAKERVAELQRRLADLQARLPAHSIPPAMMAELEEIEEELAQLQSQPKGGG